jgi:hypothetical protein
MAKLLALRVRQVLAASRLLLRAIDRQVPSAFQTMAGSK